MSFDELAQRTHEQAAELARWSAMGLIAGYPDRLDADAERIRLIQFARHRGITPDAVAEIADRQGDLIGSFVDLLLQTTGKRQARSRDDVLNAPNTDAE